jgi:hypothetical protein
MTKLETQLIICSTSQRDHLHARVHKRSSSSATSSHSVSSFVRASVIVSGCYRPSSPAELDMQGIARRYNDI